MAIITKKMLEFRYANRDELVKVSGGTSPLTYVFPDKMGSSYIKDPRKTLSAILENAGLDYVSIHDLRRTLIDNVLSSLKIDEREKQQFLGNKPQDFYGRHYNQTADIDRMREIAQDVADCLCQSVPIRFTNPITGKSLEYNGRKMISLKDNRTVEDGRFFKPEHFGLILYGDENRSPVQCLEEIIVLDNPEELFGEKIEEFDILPNGYVHDPKAVKDFPVKTRPARS